jgi:hypothetical protein
MVLRPALAHALVAARRYRDVDEIDRRTAATALKVRVRIDQSVFFQ